MLKALRQWLLFNRLVVWWKRRRNPSYGLVLVVNGQRRRILSCDGNTITYDEPIEALAAGDCVIMVKR